MREVYQDDTGNNGEEGVVGSPEGWLQRVSVWSIGELNCRWHGEDTEARTLE